MTGNDVKRIRDAIGAHFGRRISQRDLGLALGLSEKNADRAIREWETDGPTGPGAAALRLIELVLSDAADSDVYRVNLVGEVDEMFQCLARAT
jgi:hypothetical protein